MLTNTAEIMSTYLTEILAEIAPRPSAIQTMLQNLSVVSDHAKSLVQFADTEAGSEVHPDCSSDQCSKQITPSLCYNVRENTEQFEQLLTNLTASSGDVSELTAYVRSASVDRYNRCNSNDCPASPNSKQHDCRKTGKYWTNDHSLKRLLLELEGLAQKAGEDWPQVTMILENVRTLSEQTRDLMAGEFQTRAY